MDRKINVWKKLFMELIDPHLLLIAKVNIFKKWNKVKVKEHVQEVLELR